MKRMDLFCASPAATAICTSLDRRSIVRHGTRPQAHRQSDHRNDLPRTIKTQLPIPCTSYQLAITPRPKSHTGEQQKSSMDLITPTHLLSDKPFVEPVSELSHSRALVPVHPPRHSVSSDGSASVKASYSARTRDQVVVLRVSLHCKGCESKVRKHLSRMEGEKRPHSFPFSILVCIIVIVTVTVINTRWWGGMAGVRSFSIDFENKKVTVKGELAPKRVLDSVSRVIKNTQLLSPLPSPPMRLS